MGQTESWGGEKTGTTVVAGGRRIERSRDLCQEQVSVHDGTWWKVVVGADWRR